MKPAKGQIWKCIDHSDTELIGRFCIIKYIEDNPDFNGDGSIALLYSDGTKYAGKVRRFVEGITHIYIKKGAGLNEY